MPGLILNRVNKHTTRKGLKELALSFLYLIVAFVLNCRFFLIVFCSCFVHVFFVSSSGFVAVYS